MARKARHPGVMLVQYPHPVHAEWAHAAGLELRPGPGPARRGPLGHVRRDLACLKGLPRSRVLVAEGGLPARACVLGRMAGKADAAVLLAADETFSGLLRGVPEPLVPYVHRTWRWVGARLDGAVAGSPSIAEDLATLFPELPVRVVRPHVPEPQRTALLACRPRHAGHRVAHVANPAPKNGTALLVEAFRTVRRRVPDAELHLIGDAGLPFAGGPGVVAHGRVPRVADVLAACDAFALPGRGQAYPVSTLEAMLAGLPCLVSTETGTKDLAGQVDPGLVVPAEASAVADALVALLSRPAAERRRMGGEARVLAAKLEPGTQGQAFAQALDELAGPATGD